MLAGEEARGGLEIDATAMAHAKLGTTYLMNIIHDEVITYLYGPRSNPTRPCR